MTFGLPSTVCLIPRDCSLSFQPVQFCPPGSGALLYLDDKEVFAFQCLTLRRPVRCDDWEPFLTSTPT